MKGHGSRNQVLTGFLFLFFFLISLCILLSVVSFADDECEIVRSVLYENRQGEIVTDWNSGIPYRRYQVVTYPCATLTIQDNSKLMYTKEIEVVATFVDQNTIVKRAWCDKKQGEDGEIYSCIVCFESDSPIANIICVFK